MPKIKSKTGRTIEPDFVKTTGSGWAAVANKKTQNEEAMSNDGLQNFYLFDGESAVVQFLDEEPYCFDAHQIKTAKGKWVTKTCQLTTQKYCLMCEAGSKQTWRAAFRVLDYRGKWDKDKKKFVGGDPIEKLWVCSNTVALQIKSQIDKRGKALTELVFEITRSGAGAKDTSYNFAPAFDEETEKKMLPIDWESSSEPLSVLCKPPTDKELSALGFSGSDEDE